MFEGQRTPGGQGSLKPTDKKPADWAKRKVQSEIRHGAPQTHWARAVPHACVNVQPTTHNVGK